MTRKIQVHQVDAFTRTPFTGNPAGVVLNADSLDDAEMLAIARELNNADTAFILSPDSNDHDVRANFFTPRVEAGFVGHATVAAHYVLSRRRSHVERLRQKSKAGVVEIDVRGTGDDRRIAIRQPRPPVGRELNDRERLAVLDALALATDDLDLRCPIRIAGSSSTRLMVGVRGPDQLKALKPDSSRLTTSLRAARRGGLFHLHSRAAGHVVLHGVAHVLPGARHPGRSGERQRARAARRVSRRMQAAEARRQARVRSAARRGTTCTGPGAWMWSSSCATETIDAVWIVGQAVSIFETEITL